MSECVLCGKESISNHNVCEECALEICSMYRSTTSTLPSRWLAKAETWCTRDVTFCKLIRRDGVP